MHEGPAGFVKDNHKFIYSPVNKTLCIYDLSADPLELARVELPEKQAQRLADEVVKWRKDNIFRLDQQRTGEKLLFNRWLCRWNNRVSSAKYIKKQQK